MSKSIVFLCLVIHIHSSLSAQIWHFSSEAMDDLTRLNREALFEKWTPVQLSEPEPDKPGDYVQYQHETLTYYFGPFRDAESTERAQEKLLGIQKQLLERDPKFATSRVSLHQRSALSAQENQITREIQETPHPEISHQITSRILTEKESSHVRDSTNPLAYWISSALILMGTSLILKVRHPHITKNKP